MNTAVLALALVAPNALASAKPPLVERAFNTQYRLAGPLNDQIHGVVERWLLRAPDDNPAILEMFRDRDKRPLRDLLPWSGEFAGKYLTASVQVYRLTHDERLRAKIQKFVNDLVALQDADGYLGPFDRAHRLTGWAPNVGPHGGNDWDAWGHYHAMVGLLLWNEETGDPKALTAARKIGDLLCDRFLPDGTTLAGLGSPECNLAVVHSLALLYRRTGVEKYLKLAEKVVGEFSADGAGDYLNGALAGEEFFQLPARGPRWESLHAIMGLAELYWITGKPDYRKAFESLWWSIAKTDRHNNGGFSSGEQAQGDPYDRGPIETCSTIAWTAMSVDMLRMTDDPHVADELEMSTLNQIVGLHAPDGSWSTYNTPMDGVRIPSTEDIAFQIRSGSEELNCCSVNAARGFGMITDWALMRKGDGLVLNWYGPSTFVTTAGGHTLTLRQETDYPRTGAIALHVDPAQAARFPLALRIPHWSTRTKLAVNGQAVACAPGTYATLDRTWKKGDVVTVEIDMTPRFWKGQRESRGLASVYHGPILMALETAHPPTEYGPGWQDAGAMRVTQTPGARMDGSFEGDSVRWEARRYDDAGRARVSIDGREVEVVDLFAPGRDVPFTWERKGLGAGRHTIRIEALGTRSEGSKGIWINVIGIEPDPSRKLPTFDAAAFAKARFVPDPGAVGRLEVTDLQGETVRLRDFGHAGAGRVPYRTWLPIHGLAGVAFTPENPSRTNHLP